MLTNLRKQPLPHQEGEPHRKRLLQEELEAHPLTTAKKGLLKKSQERRDEYEKYA
jgi:hypothetical protein